MERLIGCTRERKTLRLVQGCSRTIIHDLRVLELGTLGQMVVTVSLSLPLTSYHRHSLSLWCLWEVREKSHESLWCLGQMVHES